MKSKKVASKPQPAQMTNAQQQQASDLQQPILSNAQQQQFAQQQPMQYPVQQQMQYPVQQQMQYPVQISMPQPGVVVPNARVGYYGNRAMQTPQTYQQVPAIFNDDEKFVESVK